VAAGDILDNGFADLIVTPDVSGGPRVTIYDGRSMNAQFAQLGLGGNTIANYFAIDDTKFFGGCRPACGDINGDGYDDLVISAGFGGGPRVSVFDGKALSQGNTTTHLVPDFFLFEQALRNGAYVAVGDVDGDGKADLIGGGGPGGGPRVLILSGALLTSGSSGSAGALNAPIANYFDGDTNARGGIRVAAKNLDGDSKQDVLTGSGAGDGSRVRSHFGIKLSQERDTSSLDLNYDAFPGFNGGIFVG
jgi:hypothetical protein